MRPNTLRTTLALAALVIAPAALAQSLDYTTIVRSWVDWEADEHYVQNDPNLQTATMTTATGHSTASAQISPGVNHTFAHWESLDENTPAERLISDAQTYWTDTITIDDPELTGTLGTFTASLRVFGNASFELGGAYANGDFFSEADVYGFWDTWIGTSTDGGGSFLVGGWFGDWRSDEFGTVWYTGDDLNQEMTPVTLEFIYGQPFLLRTNLEAYMDADNPNMLAGTVQGTLDFSHTTYWNGIGGFYDANGNPTNPTFASESGIDWRNPVPEPSTWMALGLGAVALLRRRR